MWNTYNNPYGNRFPMGNPGIRPGPGEFNPRIRPFQRPGDFNPFPLPYPQPVPGNSSHPWTPTVQPQPDFLKNDWYSSDTNEFSGQFEEPTTAKLKSLENSNKAKDLRIEELKSQLESARKKNSELIVELSKRNSKVTSTSNSSESDKSSGVIEKSDQWKNFAKTYELETGKKLSTFDEFVQEYKTFKIFYNDKLDVILAQNEKNKELAKTNGTLGNTVGTQRKEIATLTTEILKLKDQSNQIGSLKKKVKEWDEFVENYSKETGKDIHDSLSFIYEYETLRNTNSARLQIIAELEKNLKDLRQTKVKEIRSLKKKLIEKTKEIKRLKKEQSKTIVMSILKDNIAQITQLHKELSEKDATIAKINSVSSNMNEKYGLQNEQIYNLKSENKFYEQKLRRVQDQIKMIQGTLKEEFIVSVDEPDEIMIS